MLLLSFTDILWKKPSRSISTYRWFWSMSSHCSHFGSNTGEVLAIDASTCFVSLRAKSQFRTPFLVALYKFCYSQHDDSGSHDHSLHSSHVGHGGHGGHEMKMWFHGGWNEVILFDFWRIESLSGSADVHINTFWQGEKSF